MATPESLVKALAAGLVEALLKTEKSERPKNVVVKTDDIKAAVKSYLDDLARAEEQPDLFTGAHGDDERASYDARVAEAERRAAHYDNEEPNTYSPDQPEDKPWTSPVS